jgi:hypothetical protein
METLLDLLSRTEFWMGLSLLAAALPGPQTRLLPVLLRAIGRAVSQAKHKDAA